MKQNNIHLANREKFDTHPQAHVRFTVMNKSETIILHCMFVSRMIQLLEYRCRISRELNLSIVEMNVMKYERYKAIENACKGVIKIIDYGSEAEWKRWQNKAMKEGGTNNEQYNQ